MVTASNYEYVRNLVLGLSADEQAKIKAELDGQPNFSFEDLISFKANTGIKCPHCGNVGFVKNGTRNGVQRYRCTSCQKSFNSLSQSFLSRTHKDFETWKSYAYCLSEGYSLRKAAKHCNISLPTAFYWRHKLLNIVRRYVQRIKVSKLVESDETYFAFSEKGRTPKDRPAKKRGEPAQRRGLSRDKVCVSCAVSRHGKLYSKVATRGHPSSTVLEKVLKKHISSNTTLVTDGDPAYRRFATNAGINLVQVKAGRAEGYYHIQTVNSYHSRLKAFMLRFKGVATKYLDNYLAYHNLIVERQSDAIRILRNVVKVRLAETWREVVDKTAMPVTSQ